MSNKNFFWVFCKNSGLHPFLDYAFVHFKNRDEARSAMTELNGFNLEGQCIEICLAKPQDKKLKEKKLERQMQKQMAMSGTYKIIIFLGIEFSRCCFSRHFNSVNH